MEDVTVIFSLLVIACLIVLAVWGVWMLLNPPEPSFPHTYTVRPGDTLWDIAASYAEGDVREELREIIECNGLGSTIIYPGDVLIIP